VNNYLPSEMKALGLKLFTRTGEAGGRVVTCSTCHDIHGVSDMSGTPRPQFLRYEVTNGDLCVRCHKDEGLVRETPHDMTGLDERPLGICSPCHGVHATGSDEKLFILDYDTTAFTKPAGRCRACHLNSNLPLGEPLMQYHMRDADEALTTRGTIFMQYPMVLLDQWAMRSDAKPVIPLYDRDLKPNAAGELQCPSCHDPHIWSPLGPNFTPKLLQSWHGERIPNKFTRLEKPAIVKDSVCKQCHPIDTVQYYWDYHRANDVIGDSFNRGVVDDGADSDQGE
jgi:predicted CXXCH cytochrome family protein